MRRARTARQRLLYPGESRPGCGAYLNRYRDQPKTLWAYTKELERFLLWVVVLRGKALSDLRVDACEACKDFLKDPDPRFVAERFPRHSPRWRPFSLLDRKYPEAYLWLPPNADDAKVLKIFHDGANRIHAVAHRKLLAAPAPRLELTMADFSRG